MSEYPPNVSQIIRELLFIESEELFLHTKYKKNSKAYNDAKDELDKSWHKIYDKLTDEEKRLYFAPPEK
jgi:diketogulonate reductase-like aldo/keto reductase